MNSIGYNAKKHEISVMNFSRMIRVEIILEFSNVEKKANNFYPKFRKQNMVLEFKKFFQMPKIPF